MNVLAAGAAIVGVAVLAVVHPPLAAQTIYRCGTEYRAEPCAGVRTAAASIACWSCMAVW